MSEARSSMDLSKFFNDDDSEGHRFVDFIKQRRGVRKQNFLFLDCETDRMSFEVQLKKLPTPQVKNLESIPGNKANGTASEKQIKSGENGVEVNENIVENASVEQLPSDSLAAQNFQFSKPQDLPPKSASLSPYVRNINSIRSERANRSPVRKNGGVCSTSDRLRRFSIKNYSAKKLVGGRRTLLQEFESTIEDTNFNPPICSTPLSQPIPNIPQLSSNTITVENENSELNIEHNLISKETCGHTDTIIRTLQRKDAELKDYMDSLEKTLRKIEDQSKIVQKNSTDNTLINRASDSQTLKRTFTVERGSAPGQLVLTPHQRNHENNRISILEQSPKQNLTGAVLSTSQRSHENRKSTAENRSNASPELQKTQSENIEIPMSSHNNLSIIFPTQNVEIPETEKITKSNILICSGREHLVLIPCNQTISKTTNQEGNNTNSKNSQISNCSSADQRQTFQQAEDNLKLTDIITDDEENIPKSAVQDASEMPLNLAKRSYNLRKNRRRKLESNNKLHEECLRKLTLETQEEIQHTSYSNRKKSGRRPLNKAPGVPLNGEKYAQELARMSNYEILDLRKRNSMGQIFAILGRKSRRSLEEANKMKHQLDEQIENELLKRKLDTTTQQAVCELCQESVQDERIPAPSNLQDYFAAQKRHHESFIGEKPSDLVKFNTRQSRAKKSVPEILNHYLQVSKRYSQRKQINSSYNKSKRSLFKHSHKITDDNDEHDNLTEKTCYEERQSYSRLNSLRTPHLRSPPKTQNDIVTTPKVVSPPTAINTASETQKTPIKIHSVVEIRHTPHKINENAANLSIAMNTNADKDLNLPPPPPGFESDPRPDTSRNNDTKTYTTNVTIEVGTAYSVHPNLHSDNDDQLFKRPTNPVPKRKGKKVGRCLNALQESAAENQSSANTSAEITEGGSLRRSKRGQVPICLPPILGILYQQQIERNKRYEKQKKINNKNQNKKTNKLNENKTLNSAQNSKYSKSSSTTVQENSESLANDIVPPDCWTQSTKAVKKTKSTKVKSKQTHNDTRSQKEHLSPKENIQGNSLIRNSVPYSEHLSNVFDQLKQTSDRLKPVTQQLKIKPLKVRVCRSKPLETILSSENPNVSSSSTNSNTNSNIELVSWLKNMSDICNTDKQTTETLKDVRISSATDLCFTELQGVEYAFYDTVEKASLGYLRFKAQQLKPKKRAKRFDLHFINLIGLFRITINNLESVLGVGDMVTIEKLAYYDIQNISDDIGILMVIKK